jgi:hypothetical protein
LFTHLSPEDEKVFAYIKDYKTEKVLVLLNFTKELVEYTLPGGVWAEGTEIKDWIGNGKNEPSVSNGTVKLGAYEGYALVLS